MGVLLLRPAARYIGWRARAWWHLRAERIRADGRVRTTLVPRTGEFFSLEIAIGSCRTFAVLKWARKGGVIISLQASAVRALRPQFYHRYNTRN